MDVKNNREVTLNSDGIAQKEKVLLALSGGVDSMVMAYLLKIQKYDLSAVTIVINLDEVGSEQDKFFSCYISPSRLTQIKDFCQKLNIPHFTVKISSEFKELVVEPWMADRVSGKKARPCWDCHELKMNLVFDKMLETGADKIATGHYAKLFHNEASGAAFVHSSNDETNDQSALLSRLKHDILSRLVLPLSDLSKKEVLKLADNFGVSQRLNQIPVHGCLSDPELSTFIEQKVPKKFLKEGDITNPDGTIVFGQHQGAHLYPRGSMIDFKESGKAFKGIVAGYVYNEKKIIVSDPSTLMKSTALLTNCHFSEGFSLSEPCKAYITLSGSRVVECWIHGKSLSSVYVELIEPQSLISGEIVSVQKKKGKNAKILLTGEIRTLRSEIPAQERAKVPQLDRGLDF